MLNILSLPAAHRVTSKAHPVLVWLLLSVGAVSLGCDGSISSVERESRQAAVEWTAAADSSAVMDSVAPQGAGGIRLYIDASRSMSGFAGCVETPTRFNTLLDRLTSDLAITRAVRFGERTAGSGQPFEEVALSRAVHCSQFYDRLQNPDFALYNAAMADSTGATFLYLTDGVQSDWTGPNPGPSIGALRDWVQADRTLAILSFRSEFNGPAWSEQRQRMLQRVSVPDRPFYLFILAPDDTSVDGLLRRLSRAVLTDAHLIRFGTDRVHCESSAADKLPKYRQTSVPPWAMVRHDALARTNSILKYQCQIAPEYPVASVQPQVTMLYRAWSGNAFNDSRELLPGTSLSGDSVDTSADGSTAVLQGRLPFDNAARFGLYQMKLSAEAGALRPEVEALSTDSDASADGFGQTYRFSWMIEHLVRVDIARQAWSPFTLTVQYR